MSNTKQVIHHRDGCIGCGMCAYLCPNYFKMNEKDGLADLIKSKKVKRIYKRKINLGDEQDVKTASKSCPVNIIKVQ